MIKATKVLAREYCGGKKKIKLQTLSHHLVRAENGWIALSTARISILISLIFSITMLKDGAVHTYSQSGPSAYPNFTKYGPKIARGVHFLPGFINKYPTCCLLFVVVCCLLWIRPFRALRSSPILSSAESLRSYQPELHFTE